jgi:hypothetical protein
MDINTTRPGPELSSLTASALQNTRFKERRLREAESLVRNDAVYFSPVLRIDTNSQTVILEYRDNSTGEVQIQYPSEKQVKSYVDAQSLKEDSAAALDAVDREITKA